MLFAHPTIAFHQSSLPSIKPCYLKLLHETIGMIVGWVEVRNPTISDRYVTPYPGFRLGSTPAYNRAIMGFSSFVVVRRSMAVGRFGESRQRPVQ